MSAIWGTVSFNNCIPEHVDSIMRSYYSANCRIDRSNIIQYPNFYFGCGIQFITTEASKELLPLYDTSRNICFTADCLLDNRDELLHLLGENDASLPDGRLMVLAYLKWGINCVQHLRGLFSFAVYDIDKNTVYLATDQLSSRCLYYYRDQEQLSFSTLLTPLHTLHSSIPYNQLYIKDFLTLPGLMPGIVSNETPFEHMYKLNPATYLEITPNSMKEFCYWSPSMPLTTCNCKTPDEYGSYFRTLYEACIHDALRTNGNIGIALSSGLDSSSVGAIAADILQKDHKNLYTYTYVPYEPVMQDKNSNNIHNEEKDVMEIVKMHPNMIPHFLCNDGKNCYGEIASGIHIMEMPYKAYGNLPSLFEIYQKASDSSCKIMLSGQMGNSTVSYGNIDHILYDLYSNQKYLTFLKYLNHYSKTVKESRRQALKGCIKYFQHTKKEYSNLKLQYTPDNPFLSKLITKNYPMEERYANGELSLFKGNLPAARQMYQKYLSMRAMYTYMGELETKAGLAYGMILRDPTKDMRILSFCYHLPYHLFAYRGVPRWLIRNHTKDILPGSILNHWMRYGVQNSDCHTRLMRDWKQIYPKIKEQLTSPEIIPFLNAEVFTDYLRRTEAALEEKDEAETQYLLFIDVLSSFFQYTSKNQKTIL